MSRRWVFGPVSFFAALAIGLSFNWQTPVENSLAAEEKIQPAGQTKEVVALKPENVFIPEFRDLPNFEDIDYENTGHELIDVFDSDGLYRESESAAKSGETWLTLFEHSGKYKLGYAKARVKKLTTVSFPGDEPDVRLTFDKPGNPVFAVRNIKAVTEGLVTTLYHRPSQEEIVRRNLPIYWMEEGFKREFNLDEKWYVLRVSNGITRDGTKVGVLVLENDGRSQVIKQLHLEDMNKAIVGRLLWVGDLDRDGKLDLYFDEFNEKGYFSVELYLSTASEAGQLVKSVASFGTGGC